MFLTCLALATLTIALFLALDMARGVVLLKRLEDITAEPGDWLPRISVIVAARNEARAVRAGVLSLLGLDYPRCEVIVVNDRSTDRTGELLAAVATTHPALRVVTVETLPAGWLGKNHALHLGAAAANGDYLVFTDADVVMEKTVLRRALRYAAENHLDHLAISPAASMPGAALNMFMVGFTIFFNAFTRPWRVRDPKSGAHIGIGAFNLVRRSAYDAIGGHTRIALRPDDDLKLGKLIKKNGYRSDFVIGAPLLGVEWYSSVGDLVRGLEKNAFAGCDYQLAMVVAGVTGQIWIFLWPWAALFVGAAWQRALYGVTIAILFFISVGATRAQRLPLRYAAGLPLASLLFVFILVRTTFLNLRQGGITWRGTFYPLDLLKKNTV